MSVRPKLTFGLSRLLATVCLCAAILWVHTSIFPDMKKRRVVQSLVTQVHWIAGGGFVTQSFVDAIEDAKRLDNGRCALPELSLLLTDCDAAWVVCLVLSDFGPEGVPILTEALRNDHARTRATAAETLGAMGPIGFAAAPTLRAALKDQDEHVRIAAASALDRVQ